MNRNTILGTLGVSLLLFLAGMVSQQEANSIHSVDPVGSNSPSSQLIADRAETKTQTSQLASANNRFGFNLWTQISQQQPEANIVISPSSIAIALAMARNGTDGSTKAEMTTVLELDLLDPATMDNSYGKLIENLKTADPNVKLAIANSLWVNRDITLKDSFVNNAKEFYQAEVTNLDFADSQAKNTINDWVASNTANQISEIVDSVSADDALYLINAIYFKGIWAKKFDVDATVEQPFYTAANDSKSQPMMSQTGDYRYYQSDRFQAVRLPYGEKEELGMYIFLPQETSSLAEFNQQLNYDNWQEWISSMRSRDGKITIPRFKLEYELDLTESLSELGIEQVFDSSQADFSAMTDLSVAVDGVKHKTFIEVNEEGTEAAGVTSIGIRITSVQTENESFKMNVNRPFFFAIRDDITESIIFMGNVIEP
ncbi:serpin family protein [Waterburya agarophytonicola K14]|uniref:Serpin family protein n=1 Tax=Waterburya agarophytonicola KI4 TaxID=2874699 RepID=A0A964BQW1_9CYAN|nr:serpin family protein [Waterburya agarophytonicola]MCC0177949.1 serpin family protein [Waterburya agarophytonicola KI4]